MTMPNTTRAQTPMAAANFEPRDVSCDPLIPIIYYRSRNAAASSFRVHLGPREFDLALDEFEHAAAEGDRGSSPLLHPA